MIVGVGAVIGDLKGMAAHVATLDLSHRIPPRQTGARAILQLAGAIILVAPFAGAGGPFSMISVKRGQYRKTGRCRSPAIHSNLASHRRGGCTRWRGTIQFMLIRLTPKDRPAVYR